MVGALIAVVLSAHLQTAVSRTVLAGVTAGSQPIVDLEADDFVVREDGQNREILGVRIADYPVVVLIDNSRERDFDAIRSAAARFIDRMGQRQMALGTLANPPAPLTSFDDDRATLRARLDQVKPASAGAGMLLRGIADAARIVANSGTLFSAIVVISSAPSDASSGALNELVGQILASGAAVHVIANGSGDDAASMDELRGISEQTKGQFTTIYSAASYQIALDRLADQMAAEMMIEYMVPVAGSTNGDVMVGVRVPGALVKGLGVR